jgi:hypothetical protein
MKCEMQFCLPCSSLYSEYVCGGEARQESRLGIGSSMASAEYEHEHEHEHEQEQGQEQGEREGTDP